jgi:hypothetical protein
MLHNPIAIVRSQFKTPGPWTLYLELSPSEASAHLITCDIIHQKDRMAAMNVAAKHLATDGLAADIPYLLSIPGQGFLPLPGATSNPAVHKQSWH